MRAGFVSGTGLLGSITLPICVLISAGSIPLIGLVYGPRWLPAAQALTWLAIFGALRILFQYFYDFFVVLARSRVVFTAQLVWLVVLIPTLVLGARLRGIAGVGMAEVAVATCVLAPWYLAELHKAGVMRRALCVQLWTPLVGGTAVGLFAVGLGHVIKSDLAILIASGIFALGIIGILLHKKQDEIATIKPVLSAASKRDFDAEAVDVSQAADQADNYSPDAESAIATAPDQITAEPEPSVPTAMTREGAWRPAILEEVVGTAEAAISSHASPETGGPLPVYDEVEVALPAYESSRRYRRRNSYVGRHRAGTPAHEDRPRRASQGRHGRRH
jgi:hypothetical protein